MNLREAVLRKKRIEDAKKKNAGARVVIKDYDSLIYSNNILRIKAKENRRDFDRRFNNSKNNYKLD